MKRHSIVLAIICCIVFSSCSVKKTEEGELPEVNVETQGGDLPKYKVEWTEVEVKKRTKTVRVPKVVVVMEEQEIEVPYLEFDNPEDNPDAFEEETVSVEVEVEENVHDIKIERVYVSGDRLIVVSELERKDQTLGNKRMRVSDRIIINSPESLSITHYIVGERPAGAYNSRYRYVTDPQKIAELEKAQLIYSR